MSRHGTETTNFIDLYKAGHFALEAKDEESGRSPDLVLRQAFGQLRSYIGRLPDERPPYHLVLDVAKTMFAWDRQVRGYPAFESLLQNTSAR